MAIRKRPLAPTVLMPRALLAAALATAAGPALAQSSVIIGRLFASPQERATLDAQRDESAGLAPVSGQGAAPQNGRSAPAGGPAAGADPAPAPPLQLNGVVRRSDGRSTVWLNQVPRVDAGNALQDQTLSVRLSSGRQVILKPGQSFNPADGTIQDDTGK